MAIVSGAFPFQYELSPGLTARAVRVQFEGSINESARVLLTESGLLSAQTAYIVNASGSNSWFRIGPYGQTFLIPAFGGGYVPIMCPTNLLEIETLVAAVYEVWIINIPIPPVIW